MSTYQSLYCVIRDTICSCACKAIVSVRQALSSFAMPLWFFAVILLSVSFPVRVVSATTGSAEQPDSLQNCDSVSVFTENILFPKSSAVILRDFAENGSAIDSIRRFFTVADSLNLIDVKVIGSHSPEGRSAFNKKLAKARARALGNLVRELAPAVNPEVSTSQPAGDASDYRSLRSAKLQIFYRKIVAVCEKMLPDTAVRQEKVVAKEPCDSVAAETQSVDTVSTITPPQWRNSLPSK